MSEKDYAELKAENAELKKELDIALREENRWKSNFNNYRDVCRKQYQTLQEIKGVVTALYMNNWLQMNETARKSIQLLQELITKAEEE